MSKTNKIRVLALGVIRDRDRIFLSEGYDPIKEKYFYRALGGGVDFGETSLAALQREFQEELQVDLSNIYYLGCLENVFVFNGKPGHEIIQLYQCDFADATFYQREEISFQEGKREKKALWVNRDRCLSGELNVVPKSFLKYL
ncbi:NUDIX hydrolase [Spirulina sp. 06S082]|uniref:NUDIX hydrolase n=1 Tax=Spirulina sp. 06S082 TaxID=3110248 RepID=UPI002B214A87|nr:NUDIX domain-containing protein [Spirulina sp. 06S082]MEA5468405.1 NUDIX domain-containing protein [Spirulina sp. 06S082]